MAGVWVRILQDTCYFEMLVAIRLPVAVMQRMYTKDGILVASCVQEVCCALFHANPCQLEHLLTVFQGCRTITARQFTEAVID